MPVPKKPAAKKKVAPNKPAEDQVGPEHDDNPEDLAPDAGEPGDPAPEHLMALCTPSDQVAPDHTDKPDPKNQVSG